MIEFLVKGLIRDRSRSFFPVLMVCAGAFLTVFLYSFMRGAIGDMVDSNARFDTGHVKIMTRAYSELPDQMPNDLALLGTADLVEQLEKDRPDMVWVPRIKFGGLLDIPDENGQTRSQGPTFGMGVGLHNPDSPEIDILNLKKSIVRGSMPRNRKKASVWERNAHAASRHVRLSP